ncbi:MAG: hypothetical protein RL637_112 [Pseudomonadota bacterium]|jgi:pathogenesis-related protein 1
MFIKIFGLVLLVLSIHPVNADTLLSADEQRDILNAHHRWRQSVQVPNLIWSNTLATSAQVWADQLKTSGNCQMQHGQNLTVGENLFWASAIAYSDGNSKIQSITGTTVTDSWGNEKADYHPDNGNCTLGTICGHYTQVVWKNTQEIGCGKAICADNSQVWVCHYHPAGNIKGQKPY